ncbi:hypothetical protein AB0I60_21530 [Actinosynnema sp. NPDC050436]|uniref:hypothetical protein n=1 Tax=Actinosynnema sp. NPDC050436 TaxID=3155659 RepID=UPI0033DBD64E
MALCGVLVASSVVVTAQPAGAVSSGWKTVYSDLFVCLKGTTAITRRIPGTLDGNHATADANLFGYALDRSCTRAATGYGRVRVEAERYYENDDTSWWSTCRDSGWKYAAFGWRDGPFPGPYGPSVLLDYGGAVCGASYYRAEAFFEYLKDGAWTVAGSVRSPSIWVD